VGAGVDKKQYFFAKLKLALLTHLNLSIAFNVFKMTDILLMPLLITSL
jgi:hypothetical protein